MNTLEEPPLIDDEEGITLWSMLELQKKLGNVPAERILMRPYPGTATEDDIIRLEACLNKRLCELIDGTLVEKAMGNDETLVAGELYDRLSPFVKPRKLGFLLLPDGMVRTRSQRIRLPDLAYYSRKRMPKRLPGPIWPLTPDIAIEVLSKSNTGEEMEIKRMEYFSGGTSLVWELNPRKRNTRVFTNIDQFTVLGSDDKLTGGDVLPGFEVRVGDLFQILDDD